ncbi:FHA domain-containing protein [Natroniella sulfidigena]|uniref:FHA domain-containing protein n=1 Tax=Natroniella sulfidigena TaxID=723921 RepID=UPI00200A24B8|nr:FHA domain-containing protein [Natroniella sulfidigena]MCK8817816.1 FHA domain-containing protein [Natroniella sulfidigena]
MGLRTKLSKKIKAVFSEERIKDETDTNIQDTKDDGTKIFTSSEQFKDDNYQEVDSTRKIIPVSRRKCSLKLLNEESKQQEFIIDSIETNIGRQETNEIVLADLSVSRVHAQIITKKHYYLIKDLNSTNGLWVNNQLVKKKKLFDQDIISIGNVKLKFSLNLE